MKRNLSGTITLPSSKSESNRALMIAAYGGFPAEITRLSEAHDTQLLMQLLKKIEANEGAREGESPLLVDCEDAGTVARFLLTYLAGKPGIRRMTGTERLCQRPMRPLVEALRVLGADIRYEKEEGFLPVRIKGKTLTGGTLCLDASQSSQFASSLLLAAPMWRDGLTLRLRGEVVSKPYLHLTVEVMRHFGAQVMLANSDTIEVAPRPYVPAAFQVGGDWTSASYWYELAALSPRSDLVLRGLNLESDQGDQRVVEMFERMGVHTLPWEDWVRLRKTEDFLAPTDPMVFDFHPCPDLFPAVFVTCVALQVPAVFLGIQNLALKESDRVEALLAELSKTYTLLYNMSSDEIELQKSYLDLDKINDNDVIFSTYSDHRVALSLAPLMMRLGKVKFDDPKVVSKSYPSFWVDFQSITRIHLIN